MEFSYTYWLYIVSLKFNWNVSSKKSKENKKTISGWKEEMVS